MDVVYSADLSTSGIEHCVIQCCHVAHDPVQLHIIASVPDILHAHFSIIFTTISRFTQMELLTVMMAV